MYMYLIEQSVVLTDELTSNLALALAGNTVIRGGCQGGWEARHIHGQGRGRGATLHWVNLPLLLMLHAHAKC